MANNNTIDISTEIACLNEFQKQYPNVTSADLQSFTLGMQAIKAKDKAVIDKLIEALKSMVNVFDEYAPQAQWRSGMSMIKQLIQSIEKETI